MQIHHGAMAEAGEGGLHTGDRDGFEVTKQGNEGFRGKGV